ncbi:MAG: YbaK/EbsC family protein, partial [Candidatus Bathyarchaeia archaeon]
MSRASLESYLRSNGVEFRILTFKEHTITVDDAVRQLKVPKERIIKSILFVDERGSPILGVVTGDRKVSEDKIAKVCGAKTLKKARSRAVRSITGYEVGAL